MCKNYCLKAQRRVSTVRNSSTIVDKVKESFYFPLKLIYYCASFVVKDGLKEYWKRLSIPRKNALIAGFKGLFVKSVGFDGLSGYLWCQSI